MLLSLLGLIALTSVHFIQSQINDPVKVSVYYETLCPYSIQFFVEQLEPTYNEISNIMMVDTHAYGNVKETPRISGEGYIFLCQHGEDECYGNKILACGQKYITDHEVFLKFNFCVMGASYPPSSGVQCSNEVGVSPDIIIGCANSTEGEDLLHDVGKDQGQLDPNLTYVPWIIINDEFREKNFKEAWISLKFLVCSTYGECLEECKYY